jgi:hypothetical protein
VGELEKLRASLELLEKISVVEKKLKEFREGRDNLHVMLNKEIKRRIKEFQIIPPDLNAFKKKAYDDTYNEFSERISFLEEFKESLYLGITIIQRDTQSVRHPDD